LRLVVDTNILFAFFWKNSVIGNIIKTKALELYAPEFSLNELSKYSSLLMNKTSLSKEEYIKNFASLSECINIVPFKEYKDKIESAKSLANEFSKEEFEEFVKDIDFIALALKLDCPIWSGDKLLKKQKIVEILTKKELLDKLKV